MTRDSTRQRGTFRRMPLDDRQVPAGCLLQPLQPHRDDRGSVCELHRDAWNLGPRPLQWNAVISRPGTLRGFHCHLHHADQLTVLQGRMLLGLRDLRPGSPTCGMTSLVELSGDRPETAFIPPGVGHGFLFPEPALHVYAMDAYWDMADEFGCAWNDAGLGIPWPVSAPLLSERDRLAGTFAQLASGFAAAWRKHHG